MDKKEVKTKDSNGSRKDEEELEAAIGEESGKISVEKEKNWSRREGRAVENFVGAIKDKEIRRQIYKTMAGTVASVIGVKSFYNVPEYFREKFKVRGLFGKGKGLGGSVEELLSASWLAQERLAKKEVEGEKSYKTREAIKDLNKRLKLTKEGSQRGSEQRKLLAKILRENRQKEKMLKEEREAEIKKILDEYTTTKITGVQATREALNTFFVASGAYSLRGLSYGFLDGVDRYLRLKKEAKREGRKVNVLKDVIEGGIKETIQAAFLKNKAEAKKPKKRKVLEMIRAWGKIGRYVGIGAAVEYRPESFGNDIDKLLDVFEGKISADKIFDNYQGNVERIYESCKKIGHISRKIFSPREAWAERAPLFVNRHPEYSPFKSLLPEEEKVSITRDIDSLNNSLELATIHKGEGIEHALIRQLKENPQKFGFEGNINNAEALNKWAGQQAHRIAIKSGYVDSKTGREVRVGTKGIDKAAYVLEKDEKGEIKVHEYFKEKGDFAHKETHNLAKTYKEAEFEGSKKDSYEYIHSEQEKPSAASPATGAETGTGEQNGDGLAGDSIPDDGLVGGSIPNDDTLRGLYYGREATDSRLFGAIIEGRNSEFDKKIFDSLPEEWKEEKAPAVGELRGEFVYGSDNLRNEKIEFGQEHIGADPEKLKKVFQIADTREKLDFFVTHSEFIEYPEEAQDIFQIQEIAHSKINADLPFDKILNYYHNVFSRIKSAEIKAGLAELFYKPDSIEAKKLIFESVGITDKNILDSVETLPLPTNEAGVSFHFKIDNADDIYIDIKGTGECIIRSEDGSIKKVFPLDKLGEVIKDRVDIIKQVDDIEAVESVKKGKTSNSNGIYLQVENFYTKN